MEENNSDGLRKRISANMEVESMKERSQETDGPDTSSVERLRKLARQLHEDCVEQMDKNLHQVLENILHEIEHSRPIFINSLTLKEYSFTDRCKSKSGGLSEKQFISRRSPLTEMFESEHIRSIYHIFIAVLVLLCLNTVVYDYVDTGKLNLDFGLIRYTFSQFHVAMSIWGVMLLSTVLVVYPGFHHWANNRHSHSDYWDYSWLALYLVYICMFLYFPVVKIVEYELPPASSLVVLAEQVRILMKSHAFVRSNAPRAMKYIPPKKDDPESEDIACPDFSKFLYFLFAPTLIYRDEYPRCSKIRWGYVISNFAQVLGCLFYTYFIFVRFYVPVFHKFGDEPMSPKSFVLSLFGSMLPAFLVLLCTFFSILHSWLNAFAEMLRFADRMFYKDWWNSTSFSNYYRTWNVVVHDWLYTYIFSDVYLLVKHTRHRKLVPTLIVFAVSALVHEYLIAFMLRFFFPALLILFGFIGVVLTFVSARKDSRYGNVLMWFALVVGTGLLMTLYSMEYFARINCPKASVSVKFSL
ncbi:hypothetical protein CHUAL_007391 [Chamberlinius hualienensis]